MYERKCPNCGGDKIIFENGHFKCAFCDAVFVDKTSDKATFKYTAQVYQAKEHLKVGNFERAYEISYKLSDLHPTDPSPYAIMLLSITSKLTVYKLPEDKRNEAADIWCKMERLNAIAQPMAVYAENMFQKKMNMVKEKVICAALAHILWYFRYSESVWILAPIPNRIPAMILLWQSASFSQ